MYIFVIKSIRKKKNISLNDLSNITKITKSYLSSIENNKRFNISLDKLYKIANALNVNVKSLFYTALDIEDLRNDLHSKISQYGLDSKETLEISKLIDLLVNLKLKELD